MLIKGFYGLTLTWGDKLLMVSLLVLSLLSIVLVDRFVGQGSVAVVEVDGQQVYRLDLSVDGQKAVNGPLGDATIEVRDSRIRVVSSPCPYKLCVRMGWARTAGDVIVCVPNRVVIRVEGEGDVDAVTW